MLRLVQSNNLNSLATRLCEDIRSPIDAFEPETILVQSLGVGQWLKRGIAERLGIAANLNLKLPAHFLWDLPISYGTSISLKPQITSRNHLTETRSR
ncbi:MAG: hypothetical protein EBY55_04235 [Gammaproteobacteria bacterium]|nr:hypothetical protein [Gammaproteobacteria bacterium]